LIVLKKVSTGALSQEKLDAPVRPEKELSKHIEKNHEDEEVSKAASLLSGGIISSGLVQKEVGLWAGFTRPDEIINAEIWRNQNSNLSRSEVYSKFLLLAVPKKEVS